MNIKKFKEKISVFVVKKPARAILTVILLGNVLLISASALIISHLAPSTIRNTGFWASIFYTITMILDAGCIQFVVEDIGTSGVGLSSYAC